MASRLSARPLLLPPWTPLTIAGARPRSGGGGERLDRQRFGPVRRTAVSARHRRGRSVRVGRSLAVPGPRPGRRRHGQSGWIRHHDPFEDRRSRNNARVSGRPGLGVAVAILVLGVGLSACTRSRIVVWRVGTLPPVPIVTERSLAPI